MRYATLPGTELRVSSISLGTAALGSVVDRGGSFALLDAFVQAGGTLVDTAHVYADWHGGERALARRRSAAAMRRIRKHVLQERGLDHATIVTRGYWKLGAVDYTDHD